ncbi:MAG TPA: oxaloacetate decarboxylase [Dehalococcoidia bacterium]|nr:oxaloacetate decarboxylase [Dehalococcoidia bacterium]
MITGAARLRSLLSDGELLVAPGVPDALAARLVQRAKFSAVYVSGGAIARSRGTPDLGLLTMSEVLEHLRPIVDAVTIPVIADADTGYGNALNVHRTVQEFSAVGVAALHLEDQESPKRCGHLDDKTLIPGSEMVQKLRAAVDARGEGGPLLIARTDAIAVEGLEAALERALRYREAGADVLFVEAPENEEQIEAIARRLPGPKLINMFFGGKTPLLPAQRLAALGYNIVIIPSDLQRAAMRAMADTLDAISRDGDSHAMADRMVSFDERKEIVGTADRLALSERYRASSG